MDCQLYKNYLLRMTLYFKQTQEKYMLAEKR